MLDASTKLERKDNPQGEFSSIFAKINKWKKSAGDFEDQMELIYQKFSKANENLEVHNIKTIMAKLTRVQKDIGLTDVEIQLIVMTSLDFDYFTNLLIV